MKYITESGDVMKIGICINFRNINPILTIYFLSIIFVIKKTNIYIIQIIRSTVSTQDLKPIYINL